MKFLFVLLLLPVLALGFCENDQDEAPIAPTPIWSVSDCVKARNRADLFAEMCSVAVQYPEHCKLWDALERDIAENCP